MATSSFLFYGAVNMICWLVLLTPCWAQKLDCNSESSLPESVYNVDWKEGMVANMHQDVNESMMLLQTQITIQQSSAHEDPLQEMLMANISAAYSESVEVALLQDPCFMKWLSRLLSVPVTHDRNEWPLAGALFLKFQRIGDRQYLETNASLTVDRDNARDDIATPGQTAIIYLIMYSIVALGWVAYYACGQPSWVYLIILPMTLVSMTIGFDVGNQSLAVLAPNPMMLSSIHGCFTAILFATWSVAMYRHQLVGTSVWALTRWTGTVAIAFTCYQIANHYVSMYCTLSERVIFLNLCPVISLLLERLFMPIDLQPTINWRCKLSLLGMAGGAVLYSVESGGFSVTGLLAASSLVVLVIPYRMIQRYMVAKELKEYGVGLLASLDGFVLMLPTVFIGGFAEGGFADLPEWTADDSILTLMVMTCFTFAMNHLMGLLMMHAGSATAYLVWSNIANFALIIVSFALFGDSVQNAATMIGLICSVLGGIWYSVEDMLKKQQEIGEQNAARETLQAKNLAINEKAQKPLKEKCSIS